MSLALVSPKRPRSYSQIVHDCEEETSWMMKGMGVRASDLLSRELFREQVTEMGMGLVVEGPKEEGGNL